MKNTLIIIILAILFGLVSIFISRNIFLTSNEQMALIQTVFTYLSFWVTVIGISEIVKKFDKQVKPELIMVYSDNQTSRSVAFPNTSTFNLYIQNNGELPIIPEEVTCHILISRELDPTNFTSEHFVDASHVRIPRSKNDNLDRNKLVIGGPIPMRVAPNRNKIYFTLDLTFQKKDIYKIEYYFVTDYGLFPKTLKLDKFKNPINGFGELLINYE